jgi:hypothetical protein
MIVRHYCTLFDWNYLPHFQSLHKSLLNVNPYFILYAFCMDKISYQYLVNAKLSNIIVIDGTELENQFSTLTKVKNERSIVEYYFTCSPLICKYVFINYKEIPELTYLDADLYFFTNPEPLFEEMGNSSVAIIGHRFSFITKRNHIYGNYNVGWITFKNNKNGFLCLNDWVENCLNWCFQKLEDGKYADQKYLDYWKDNYEGVIELKHIGANLAIWNINNYKLSMKGDNIFVDNQPLIFYHFANLKQISQNSFKTDLSRVFKSCKGILKNRIYTIYVKDLISFKITNEIIKPKDEINISAFKFLIRKISRNIRQFIFTDIITIYDN